MNGGQTSGAFKDNFRLPEVLQDNSTVSVDGYNGDNEYEHEKLADTYDLEHDEGHVNTNNRNTRSRREPGELWKDDTHQLNRNGHHFEMVSLSENKISDEGESNFDYDSNDTDNHNVGKVHPSQCSHLFSSAPSSSVAITSGDDYDISNTYLSKAYHYLYPPDTPREVQLLRKENIAIPACYLLVGVSQGLSRPFANVYPLDLNANEAQQTTISSLHSLPSTFKLAFGFISDNIPVAGYRRKSYMLIGWAIASLSMLAMMIFSDLSAEVSSEQIMMNETNSSDREYSLRYLQSSSLDEFQEQDMRVGKPPSLSFLSFTLLLFGGGFWLADVMGDSLVAEKAKLEPESSCGQLQSSCYACQFFGRMIAAPLSTVLYSRFGPQSVVMLMAGLPSVMIPFIYNLKEKKDIDVVSTRDQCAEIWRTVCSRSVWQPMGFVYLYNVLQVGNAAWKQYLKTVLNFTSGQLNSLLVASYVLLWLGVVTYKKFFIKLSWRSIYVTTTLLNGVLSTFQIFLIKEITFGLSPFLFALGDDAFADFIVGIQILPATIMMVSLCPAGSEGASYAMFTTLSNSAWTLASAFSTLLLGVWDVSKDALERGDLSGMINLSLLTTSIQLSGILFVRLLPRTKEELSNLSNDGSKVGGFIFLLVTFGSIFYSIIVGVLNIAAPGWSNES